MRWTGLENLNESQREAVLENSCNLLIVAGAGSGKTRTLTYKMAYVISVLGVEPRNIVAITFTNKSANELRERTEKLIGSQINGMYIGTFHAVALRILRERGVRPVVYDKKDQLVLVKEIVKDLNLDAKRFPPERILSSISFHKSRMRGWRDIEVSSPFDEIVVKAFKVYQEKLDQMNGVDFDDILIRCVELLDGSGSEYVGKFKRIFIDEYQDTNHPQHILVKKLWGGDGTVCAVGDEDQSIYGFRGADVGNILRFSSEFGECRVIKLEKNYRSGKRILELANSVISRNTMRNSKTLYSDIDGGEVELKECQSEFDEADFIVRRIAGLMEEGVNPGDIGVLCRTNLQMHPIEKALMEYSIPYVVVGSIRFFDRKEIKDLLSFLRLAVVPEDDVSFLRAVASYPQGIGSKLVDIIKGYSSGKGYFKASCELLESDVLSARHKKALGEFVDRIRAIGMEVHQSSDLADFLDKVFEISGYIKYLENVREFGKIENVMALKDTKYSTVEDFLDGIALADYSDEYRKSDSVSLMTIHSAKGLEFDVVFVPGLEEGLFPNDYLVVSGSQIEEERRLFYVAITRAKRRLLLSYAVSRKRGGKYRMNRRSRFLDEISIHSSCEREKWCEIGSRVYHELYGKGVVLDLEENMVIINFYKYGIKKLLLKDSLLHFVDVEEAYG